MQREYSPKQLAGQAERRSLKSAKKVARAHGEEARRAALAEKRERGLALEMERWKKRALDAENKLRALGVEVPV